MFYLSHYGCHGMAEPGRGNMWKLYENIVRLTPEELRRKMAAKEAAQAERGPGGSGDA